MVMGCYSYLICLYELEVRFCTRISCRLTLIYRGRMMGVVMFIFNISVSLFIVLLVFFIDHVSIMKIHLFIIFKSFYWGLFFFECIVDDNL